MPSEDDPLKQALLLFVGLALDKPPGEITEEDVRTFDPEKVDPRVAEALLMVSDNPDDMQVRLASLQLLDQRDDLPASPPKLPS